MTDADLAQAERWFSSENWSDYSETMACGNRLIFEVKRLRAQLSELNNHSKAASDLRRRLDGQAVILQSVEATVGRLKRERDDAIAGREAADQAVDSLIAERETLVKERDDARESRLYWKGCAERAEESLRKSRQDLKAANALLGDAQCKQAAVELERDSLKAKCEDFHRRVVSVEARASEFGCACNRLREELKYAVDRIDQYRAVLHRIYRALHRNAPTVPAEGCSMLNLDASVRDVVAQHDRLKVENGELEKLNRELSKTCVDLRAKESVRRANEQTVTVKLTETDAFVDAMNEARELVRKAHHELGEAKALNVRYRGLLDAVLRTPHTCANAYSGDPNCAGCMAVVALGDIQAIEGAKEAAYVEALKAVAEAASYWRTRVFVRRAGTSVVASSIENELVRAVDELEAKS